jgi:hypothetical protein
MAGTKDEMGAQARTVLSAVDYAGMAGLARKETDSSALQAVKALQENSALQRLMQSVEQHQSLMRAVEGPLWELRRADVFDPAAPFSRTFCRDAATDGGVYRTVPSSRGRGAHAVGGAVSGKSSGEGAGEIRGRTGAPKRRSWPCGRRGSINCAWLAR